MSGQSGRASVKPRPVHFEADGPHRGAPEEKLHEAFLWSLTRKVTRTATVPLEGNAYAVDPSLVGRRVELRYDPADLTRIDVLYDGRPAGVATPFVTKRHTHRAVPQAKRPVPEQSGIDYLALVQKAHEEEAGTGEIDFSQLQMFESDVAGEELGEQA